MQGSQQDKRTTEAVRQLVEALSHHDIESVLAMLSEDVVWETTAPPDGKRYEGRPAVRAALEEFFRSSPRAIFETEALDAVGEQAVLRRRYRWDDRNGTPGHVRGVDLIRVHDGKVAEMLSYVKG